MRIGIVGAGVAGLSTAKVLRQVGHDVVVYDRAPDVGGVWSRTRRYPGVATQNTRDTYALSDFRMPENYPEWPSGEQVQAYLSAYTDHFGIAPCLRLEHEVVQAEPRTDGWTLTVRDLTTDRTDQELFDHLVVANGVFCEPAMPSWDGQQEFADAGGQLRAVVGFRDLDDARDRHVVVVGYGKSACDVAQQVSAVAGSTHIVARELLWKMPRMIGGVLNFKYLLLTRMGEALFRYQHLRGVDKFLHGPGDGLRRRMLTSVGTIAVLQFGLKGLGLIPRGTMEDIVKHAIGLSTDGFYERVADGTITVHRDRTVKQLLEKVGAPHIELDDGTLLPADLVVCATGYTQGIAFLDPAVHDRLTDDQGNYLLYRHVLPLGVPHLSFAGYNSSFFSPLSAEMAAIWTAAHLAGQVDLPDPHAMRTQVRDRLAFLDDALGGHHNHGTKIIPFSMHNIDELLNDLELNLGPVRRAQQWLAPIDPAAYRHVAEVLVGRLTAAAAGTQPNGAGQTVQVPAAAPV